MTSADPWQHGGPLLVLANVAVARGQYDQAGQLFDESIEVHRRVGDIWELGVRLTAGAGLRLLLGDSAQARALAAEAMSIAEELDDPRGIAWSLEVFAALAAVAGHPEEGARLWGASDGLLERLGSSLGAHGPVDSGSRFEPARASVGNTANAARPFADDRPAQSAQHQCPWRRPCRGRAAVDRRRLRPGVDAT